MVAVRFPDDLGISGDPVVPVVDQRREPKRRLPSAPVIAVPVDGIAEVVVDEVEEAEPALGDLLGVRDQAVTPLALFVTLRKGPLANADVAYSEPGIAALTSSRRVCVRPRLQPQGQAAPQLGVAQPVDRSPRELSGRHRLEPSKVPGE